MLIEPLTVAPYDIGAPTSMRASSVTVSASRTYSFTLPRPPGTRSVAVPDRVTLSYQYSPDAAPVSRLMPDAWIRLTPIGSIDHDGSGTSVIATHVGRAVVVPVMMAVASF